LKQADFSKHVQQRLKAIEQLLCTKQQDYGNAGMTDDQLYSFKRMAELQNVHLLAAWWGVFAKHTISLQNLCTLAMCSAEPDVATSLDNAPYGIAQARWRERTHDMIAYLLLLDAILVEAGKDDRDEFLNSESVNRPPEPKGGE